MLETYSKKHQENVIFTCIIEYESFPGQRGKYPYVRYLVYNMRSFKIHKP
jgi:hypothetical protein